VSEPPPAEPGPSPAASPEPAGRTSIGEGVRATVGILTAFKQALEETIDEAALRNDLRPERAREALSGALERAQGAFEGVRERMDVVTRRDLDALQAELAALRERVDRLEAAAAPAAPTAVAPVPLPPAALGDDA
jgi:polyhydroxyalkanoate synthesis regulator phasin